MPLRSLFATLLSLSLAAGADGNPPRTRPVEGLHDNTPAVYALTEARVVVAPGRVIERGVVVIRDGTIVDVRRDDQIPEDARVHSLAGKTIYAGLVDAYSEIRIAGSDDLGGAPYWNGQVTPQRNASGHYRAIAATNKKLRAQGVTAQLVAPAAGVVKGTSALVLTGNQPNSTSILHPQLALHMRLTVSRSRGGSYPNSPMGAVALARQSMYDAVWYKQAWAAYRSSPALSRPERNDALEVLQQYPQSDTLVIVDAASELYFLRADRFAREFGLNVLVRGSGHEYRRLEAIKKTGRGVLVPVNFPDPPNVSTAETATAVSLEQLLHWDLAPENPARLEAAGIRFALTSAGLGDRSKFLSGVRRAVDRGLSRAGALRALTTAPAELLEVDHIVGTVEQGKLANLVVTDGDLFERGTKILEAWVRGERHQVAATAEFDVRGSWQVRMAAEVSPQVFSLQVTGRPTRLAGKLKFNDAGGPEDSRMPKLLRVGVRDARFSCSFDAQHFGRQGVARLTGVLSLSDTAAPSWLGHITWPDGTRTEVVAERRAGPASAAEEQEDAEEVSTGANVSDTSGGQPRVAAARRDAVKADKKQTASFKVNYPLGAYGLESPPQVEAVLFRGATIWTCGPAGVLEDASLLIADGKIVAVGQDVVAPADAVVVDLAGKHLTPGIIDCHSHMATDGGVNESGQAITAEVRIGDFIDADDINIYRQLAGGVTSSNILHGSANPIGGQNQVIKLRWGALPEEMKFKQAPDGIKFALGENVTRANWTEPSDRYPRSRMGVEQLMRDAFYAAADYRDRWKAWQTTHQGLPPRRDLELEALAEVLSGSRWVHCHSYRQDEILALLRTMDGFGIQIGTFQHILEGYKVADEMARRGAMGSAFSDWWAYKVEVYDAIPYAGALMHQAGVVVSFNSDDRELARHLNHEAIKAVKYGGVSPEEALKFVTLNPARQLRIDQHVGSLVAGKHADVVIWSGSPLSIRSRCEQTWIDGRKYFDRVDDQLSRDKAAKRRNTLVQKILSSGEPMQDPGSSSKPDEELWPREDIFCRCRTVFLQQQ